jgi:hypothetical protein
MTSDHDAMTAAFTQLRRLEIGSERVKTWPRHWQRAAEAEGLITIADGTVRVVEPELVTEPTESAATLAHLLMLLDRE